MKFDGIITDVKEIKGGLLGHLQGLELTILAKGRIGLKVSIDVDIAKQYARYFSDRILRGKGGQPRDDKLAENIKGRHVYMDLEILEKVPE